MPYCEVLGQTVCACKYGMLQNYFYWATSRLWWGVRLIPGYHCLAVFGHQVPKYWGCGCGPAPLI